MGERKGVAEMSENLSGGSSSENLVSTPPRQSRPAPATTKQRRAQDAPEVTGTGPITSDDMKLKKDVTVNKPLTFKKNKKKD